MERMKQRLRTLKVTAMRARRALLSLLVLALLAPAGAAAQESELQLFVRRNFGYGGGSQIQGSFRMEAEGPDDLVRVTFMLDEQVVGTDTEAPWRVDFVTDSYALGWHTLAAEGETAEGRTLRSSERRFEFVPAAAGWEAAQRMLTPLAAVLGLVALVVVGMSILSAVNNRRNPVPLGAPRRYGVFGGAICPRCGRPFSRHWWGLNLVGGKLDRCDHCGKWSLVRAVPLEQLRAAEAAEKRRAGGGAAPPPESAEEQLRRQLDESRYTDR
jgi:hypothetical protein